MIKSMTGYGCAKDVCGKLNVTAELRSVNNRFLDCSVRLPRGYASLEDGIKSLVQKAITRGKVDVFITIDASEADDAAVSVNTEISDAYMAALKQLSERYGISNDVTAMSLARLQDVLFVEKKEADAEAVGEGVLRILGSALRDFDIMRCREGVKLHDDISARADEVERLVETIGRSPETVSEYRKKLTDHMNEVLGSTGIDEARILTEAAIFSDRVAVDEETVRLRSHISQLRLLIESAEPVGRKLDFLVQEFNREANTIGSKCSDLAMSRTVVDLKSEIEKIREQIQNVE